MSKNKEEKMSWFTPELVGKEIATSVIFFLRILVGMSIASFAVWCLPVEFAKRSIWQTISEFGALPLGSLIGMIIVILFMANTNK